MHRLKRSLFGLLGLATLASILAVVGWAVYALFHYLTGLPKELGTAFVAAIASVLVATITVMVGRYYERRKELDALYRDKKTEIYDEFLKEFFSILWDTGEGEGVEKDLVPFLREFTRKIVLWSGPEVIEAFVAWRAHLAKGTPDAKTIFLAEDFLLAIRRDLRHSNQGLRKGFFARLFLTDGELFLAMAEKNPNVTLAALAEAENAIKAYHSKLKNG